MVLSGAWGDREGIFVIFFFFFFLFFKPRRVSARAGELWQSHQLADLGEEAKIKGGGTVHKMCGKRLPWESHGRPGPWRCQVPQTDPKSPFHGVPTVLCSLPSPSPSWTCKVLQSPFGYLWLCHLHGIGTLALTASASMQEMIVKFVTVIAQI